MRMHDLQLGAQHELDHAEFPVEKGVPARPLALDECALRVRVGTNRHTVGERI
jgi:hypothetical protein